jgi:UDP-N-acetyl-D-galactosamine dehydrogenase
MVRKNLIGIVGLGYVGLPLAVEFGKVFTTVGYDIDVERINELCDGYDKTKECDSNEILSSALLQFTNDLRELELCDTYIISVPTPIDDSNQPNLAPLKTACRDIGSILKEGDIIIFESTVYPGATEDVCVPELEKASLLKFNADFYVGYSPERINPGDKLRGIRDILKITSGSCPDTAETVDKIYRTIITAGTYKAPSIKVAEAAKVIENTQRDINIALINELAIIFNKLDIDTLEVLEAAGTKWNFLNFRPGLVGGHCIGVDPYYLTHKAQSVGHHPEIILAGRRLNDNMSHFIVSELLKGLLKQKIDIVNSRILIMGFTFKENCPDVRNTKVLDIVRELKEYGLSVDVMDPWCDMADIKSQYEVNLVTEPLSGTYDGILIAVGHQVFKDFGISKIRAFGCENHIIYDLKYLFEKNEVDLRL